MWIGLLLGPTHFNICLSETGLCSTLPSSYLESFSPLEVRKPLKNFFSPHPLGMVLRIAWPSPVSWGSKYGSSICFV